MNAYELANELDGKDYPLSISVELMAKVKTSGLTVVTGSSDDIMSFCGAIDGEGDVYEGGEVLVSPDGVLEDFDNLESESEFDAYYAKKANAKPIEAFWYKDGVKWSYKTSIPHETFELFKGGEVVCVGLVFSVSGI
jgi:hypothetical protein|tara:strand:- start:3012 stop:3422 length:411 start_codon:yes stop_codon:yes gene_type:complete